MFHLRIRTQLIIFFVLQVGTILGLAGFYLHWQMRRQLERELAERLTAMAQASAQIAARAVGVAPILSLIPGDEQSRTSRTLQAWLTPLCEAGGLARLVIFDDRRHVLFDSVRLLAIGSEYVRLRFDENEIAVAAQGEATAAQLFYDADGRPFKSAYAPLLQEERVVAIVGVEGSAASLAAVAETRRVLWSLAGLSLLVATLSGFLFARGITHPLEQLQKAARAIGAGSQEVSLQLRGSEEITFLADTMAQMRSAIVRREQSLRLMLAGVAHEIRNPLGGIELYAGLLEKDCPPELKPQVQKIRAEVRRLENIVRDFLEYARPAASQPQPVNLNALVEDVREQLSSLHPQISWALRLPPELFVLADAEQLRRIIVNVANNAIAAMEGKGEIQIVAEKRDSHVEMMMSDTGPGVPDELAEKIFEPFFTTRAQGSGLGLALVRRLAEQNHGAITLVKKTGAAGAHFRLTLPAELRKL